MRFRTGNSSLLMQESEGVSLTQEDIGRTFGWLSPPVKPGRIYLTRSSPSVNLWKVMEVLELAAAGAIWLNQRCFAMSRAA
jgi:hypothetical protein